jgi:CRP/FNR family cyclic AMP-dependent transcriptional regulator
MVASSSSEGGVVTLATSGYPVHKPIPSGGSQRAQSVKVALKRRVEVLSGVPLFAGLSNRHLQAVAHSCVSRCWPSECCVVPEGTKAQVCYIIVEGTADVRRKGRTIAHLGPGEFFGEIALLDPGPRSASVTTTTEMVAVELSRQSFLGVAEENPAILLRMLEALARRLRETTEKLAY